MRFKQLVKKQRQGTRQRCPYSLSSISLPSLQTTRRNHSNYVQQLCINTEQVLLKELDP